MAAAGRCGSFAGKIDEPSIYSRALTTAEIQAIYNAGSSGKCFVPVVPPTITTQPASQLASVGSSVTFNVAASGTQPLSYQWRFNGANLTGKTTTSLTLTSLQLSNAGTYSVVVANRAGSATSAVARLTVYPVTPGVYDPASEFSATTNPSGAWSYGFSTTLGSPMFLFPGAGHG